MERELVFMEVNIDDVKINYVDYGNKDSKTILLLHGWGQNIEMMEPLGNPFSDRYRIVIPDLPGFGKSEEPKEDWGPDDYVKCLEDFSKKLNIKEPIVIGHSFGGRLAILYASRNKAYRLILFGSPVRPEASTKSLKVRFLKKVKSLPGMEGLAEKAKKYIGSRDYKAASPVMRKTLVNTVNRDLTEDSKKIEAPTLMIWGDYDTEASIDDAHLLEKTIKDSALIVLPGTHYAYLENIGRVISILDNFFGGK